MLGRSIIRSLWIWIQSFQVFVTTSVRFKRNSNTKVYFGGAFGGDLGGPLVKVTRLKEFFPESKVGFNLVYLLSNSPYLTPLSLGRIKSQNIPIILNQNGVYFKGWYGEGWELKNKELSPAYHSADYIFWQSEFCKRSAELFLGSRSDSGEVLFNAVNINKFVPRTKSENPEFTFLMTGKFVESAFYRLSGAVQSFHNLQKQEPNTHLRIAGFIEKSSAKKLQHLIDHLSLSKKISILGTYDQNEAPDIYGSADAFLMLKYMDASPNVVIEAMASGLPIIYSSTGGVPELVGQEGGIGLRQKESWDLEPHSPDPGLVSEAMRAVISNQNFHSLAVRARAVEFFNLTRWIARHKEVFGAINEK
jgi:glycosyltransferase involved in cell wall biosynthesis